MLKQRSLFEDDGSCQAYVTDQVTPIFPLLWSAVMVPWRKFLERRAAGDQEFMKMTGSDISVWLNMQATRRAGELIERHTPDGVSFKARVNGSSQRFEVRVGEDIVVSLKKLNDGHPSNYRTDASKRYWQQQRPELIPEMKSIHVIWGYEAIKSETELKLLLLYPLSDSENAWVTGVPDLTTEAARYEVPVGTQHEEDRDGFRVVPKVPNEQTGRKGQSKLG